MTSTRGSQHEHEGEIVSVPEAIEEFRNGRPVIIADDEGRENEGDLCVPAQFISGELIAFMARETRGLICVAMAGERLDDLAIPLMTGRNTSPLAKGFTVTVEARDGVTTGASAQDKAHTIRLLVDPSTRPEQLTRPGHIFPLRAREGGVAGARRPHGGLGGPRAAGRLRAGGGDLRDDARRRDDGADAGPRRLRPQARLQDRHRQRPDRPPPAHRLADRAGRLGGSAEPLR